MNGDMAGIRMAGLRSVSWNAVDIISAGSGMGWRACRVLSLHRLTGLRIEALVARLRIWDVDMVFVEGVDRRLG